MARINLNESLRHSTETETLHQQTTSTIFSNQHGQSRRISAFYTYRFLRWQKTGTVSHNAAATYYSIFKAGLKQAFIDGYSTFPNKKQKVLNICQF